MKSTLILTFLLTFSLLTFAQEVLVPLATNPRLGAAQAGMMKHSADGKATVTLPFLDDFSEPSVVPSAARWIDSYVFINNDMAKYPPSQGVATFDALDDTGALYSRASSFPFPADYLTSAFIDLSALDPSDSVYLSFFFQPGGLGNNPEAQDSLILEFLLEYRADTLIDTTVFPYDTTFNDRWEKIWSAPGMPAGDFFAARGTWFGQVMISVTDPAFFRSDFRFRFYNIASLATPNIPSWRSNADFWHLDYVLMNSGRTAGDTLFSDIAFVNPAPSMLKPYVSMPLRQYLANPAASTRDSVEMLITNLGNDTLVYEYRFDVKDGAGTVVFDTTYGNYNLNPYFVSGYQDYPNHRHPKFPDFSFPGPGADSAEFTITHVLKRLGAVQEFIRQNDTLTFTQRFYNYLAYDDGTPEAGYGLSPDGSMLAYRFTLNTPDTLRGVQIFFNRTLSGANVRNFRLVVWADNSGRPGEVLYQSSAFLKPQFEGGLNSFSTYPVAPESPLVLDAAHLTFYVGWIQQTDDNLNVGFDSTTDASSHILYNIDGSWTPTAFRGALLIRPLLGPSLEPPKTGPGTGDPYALRLYPNPTSGLFRLSLPVFPEGYDSAGQFELTVYNLAGQRLSVLPLQQEYDFSPMTRGVYLLELSSKDQFLSYQARLVVTK